MGSCTELDQFVNQCSASEGVREEDLLTLCLICILPNFSNQVRLQRKTNHIQINFL